ncbi:hypothetical protein [Streptomyces sp. NPDC002265]|uniref:hypothetical protein n=1 Tax=Streptomyces sp. NPDC002265 TaxID=3154415 RepID=UPI0033325E16
MSGERRGRTAHAARHCTIGTGLNLLHDLESIGATTLVFTTVEFKHSANSALPV